MQIEYVEIANYRKLLSVRVDLAKDKTIFVGANNSGKTSAMTALRHFLIGRSEFSLNDFTISHWPLINSIGEKWEENTTAETAVSVPEWVPVLPFLDVWIRVRDDEIHYVRDLIPTLTWSSGLLGVRLRLQPKAMEDLQKAYLAERTASAAARKLAASAAELAKAPTEMAAVDSAPPGNGSPNAGAISDDSEGTQTIVEAELTFALWPRNLVDFLRRRLRSTFEVRAFLLDPTKCSKPENSIACPQLLPTEAEALESDPLKGLIRIDEIDAQRGFGQSSGASEEDDGDVGPSSPSSREGRKLSDQLRAYYANHLDPFDRPEPSDFAALNAIDVAQKAFDKRLREGFAGPLTEVEKMGYPGVQNPRLRISTRVRPVDGLNHDAAVQYELGGLTEADVAAELRLPEDYNGLGYQNLISMVFRLMSYRDGWMKVGKAGKRIATTKDAFLPPLHLVLVEEPEAHLHAQVQQVFIQQAYKVLRKHPLLGEKIDFTTQLIVSTHSSHIAHEGDFSSLRYFRRLAATDKCSIPTTSVVDLSETFGEGETQRFVTRYIKAAHCDLFFADAAVLVEGPAERILVPYFVRHNFEFLTQCYLSWLEIGGSHAHRLQPLLEKLGLTSLVITDIDAKIGTPGKAVQPKRGADQTTRNKTLETWAPKKLSIDDLLDSPQSDRIVAYDGSFSIYVAYQQPIKVSYAGVTEAEAIANTFEDALVFQNLPVFKDLPGNGLIAKVRTAIANQTTTESLGEAMFESLKEGVKAEFALDLLEIEKADQLAVPCYIDEGLSWLQTQLRKKQHELLEMAGVIATEADKS